MEQKEPATKLLELRPISGLLRCLYLRSVPSLPPAPYRTVDTRRSNDFPHRVPPRCTEFRMAPDNSPRLRSRTVESGRCPLILAAGKR